MSSEKGNSLPLLLHKKTIVIDVCYSYHRPAIGGMNKTSQREDNSEKLIYIKMRRDVDTMKYQEVFKRKEIKYLLSEEQFEGLLPTLEKYLKVDAYGKSRINNIYFDTPDYRLIQTSLEKPVYKEKLRLRTYGETVNNTNAFIEIKKKFDGIVYKRRISAPYSEAIKYMTGQREKLEESQIAEEIASFIDYYQNLRPAMIIGYDRVAMAGIEDKNLRVTFDTNITWRTDAIDLRAGSYGKQIIEEGQCLMELKVKDAIPLEIVRKMNELGIYQISFSKYGRAYVSMVTESAARVVAAADTQTVHHRNQKGEVAYA